MKNVLIVEDSFSKAQSIKDLLDTYHISYNKKHAETYLECVEHLMFNNDEYFALILDMTIPRFRYERAYSLAGYDILKRMHYENLNLPTIVLTAYDTFTVGGSINDLSDLVDKINAIGSTNQVKVVSYKTGSSDWESDIIEFLNANILK